MEKLINDVETKLIKVTDDIIMLRDKGYVPNTEKYIQLSLGFFFKKIFEHSGLFTNNQLDNIKRIYNKVF